MSSLKIREAEALIQNEKSIGDISKGIKIFNELCMSDLLSLKDRAGVLLLFIKLSERDGLDMLLRWRDLLNFLKNRELENMVQMLVIIAKSTDVTVHDRMLTAVSLYNNSWYKESNECFLVIACGASVPSKYRAEACRYLVAADQEEYTLVAEKNLLDIISDMSYPNKNRYELIVSFIKKGIVTMLNFAKLRIIVSDAFLYKLQSCFFYNDDNVIEYRILSGQHLLSLSVVDDKEKWQINDILLQFAGDEEVEYNTRADAADVVHRMAEAKEQRQAARNIITKLGGVHAKGTLEDRSSTFYTNKQNVHEVSEQVDKFIELIIKECDIKLLTFEEVNNSITSIISKARLVPKENHAALKALNRISLDTASFTQFKVTAAEILVVVWMNILKFEGTDRTLLETRLIQELIDMANTCSSGHSSRLVNVLSLVRPELRIDYDTQIVGCISGRIQARIRNISDESLRDSVSMGMLDDASPEDKITYNKFISSSLKEIKRELHKEYIIDTQLLKEEEFEKIFTEASTKWL